MRVDFLKMLTSFALRTESDVTAWVYPNIDFLRVRPQPDKILKEIFIVERKDSQNNWNEVYKTSFQDRALKRCAEEICNHWDRQRFCTPRRD